MTFLGSECRRSAVGLSLNSVSRARAHKGVDAVDLDFLRFSLRFSLQPRLRLRLRLRLCLCISQKMHMVYLHP